MQQRLSIATCQLYLLCRKTFLSELCRWQLSIRQSRIWKCKNQCADFGLDLCFGLVTMFQYLQQMIGKFKFEVS